MKSTELRLGTLVFDPERRRLADGDGMPVELRHQAMEVLRTLAERPNDLVERDRLLDRVWQNRHGAEEGLIQCIAEIRRVLNDTDKTVVGTDLTVHVVGVARAAKVVAPSPYDPDGKAMRG